MLDKFTLDKFTLDKSMLNRNGLRDWARQVGFEQWRPWLVQGVLGVGAIAALLLARHWWISQTIPPPLQVKIQQTWELEPGERVGDYRVIGGLGDISLAMGGGSVRAPFQGEVYPYRDPSELGRANRCVLFASPQVPAYLFRLCGLQGIRFGSVSQGAKIGRAQSLHFATLRKQPDGTWAIVEPARDVLQQVLAPGKS